jgi:hypothetical protein
VRLSPNPSTAKRRKKEVSIKVQKVDIEDYLLYRQTTSHILVVPEKLAYSYKHTQKLFFILVKYLLNSYHKNESVYTDEWIKKMWYLYTMEFYAAMKKNEMLSFAGKWMELENIIPSEVSLGQKIKNRMFSFICGH